MKNKFEERNPFFSRIKKKSKKNSGSKPSLQVYEQSKFEERNLF